MRIHTLEVAGFGPYKTRQRVDFDAFADDGIFLIAGRTGAGKSSILDAICFALYDAVPRYDGAEKQLRSHHAEEGDPTEVALEFTVGGERYRVVRAPEYERPSKRVGKGPVKAKAAAELSILRPEGWEVLAAMPREVGHELDRILGLKKDQFLQVILLAQNRFQEFLLAKNDERQAVLQALFGTQRFAEYERQIVERAAELAKGLVEADAQRARDADHALSLVAPATQRVEPVETAPAEPSDAWFTAGLTSLESDLAEATAAADSARADADAATTTLTTLTERADRHRRRAQAEQSLATLDAERPDIDAARDRLVRAERAAIVEPQLSAVTRAERDQEAAETSERTARERFTAFGPPGVDDAALAARIDTDRGTLGALDQALTEESSLPALAADVTAREADVARLTLSLQQGAERIAALPALLAELSTELTATRVEAAKLDDAEATVTRLRQQLVAAHQARTLADALQVARETELTAAGADAEAAASLRDTLAAQLHGRAAVLAASLQPGEACAVCGSTEHPAPASPTDDAVTDDDVDAAHAAVDAARAALTRARGSASALAEQHAAAAASAGTTTAEQVEAAEIVRDAAMVAQTRVLVLATEVQELEAEQRELAGERDALQSSLGEAQVAVASARSLHDSTVERVAGHRGDFASVGERAAALRETIAAATALQAARATLQQRSETVADAIATRDAALAEHGFDDPATASGYLLPAHERSALEKRIRTHQERSAVAQATLAELPAEPVIELVEITTAEDAVAAARARLSELTELRGAIAQRHRDYTELLAEVRARAAADAALRARHEEIASLAAAAKGDNAKRMRLETYVLAAQLEEIVAAANARLTTMTAGRYELQHSDALQKFGARSGLGLAVLDQHTGRARPPHSLSGGETFLASLALALGLADVVTAQSGGITLDTLFVDEGFGSLDADKLSIAMGTLDSLRQGGRTIGLISHVDAMKEQIHAKLTIRVADGGWSEIVQDA